MSRVLCLAAAAIVLAAAAVAQPVTVEQIAPSTRRHVADVDQVPANRTEPRGAALPAPVVSATANGEDAAPGSVRRGARARVDADEIARLLSSGQVGSIDAAAAVATGALDTGATAQSGSQQPLLADDADSPASAHVAPREQR